MPVHALDNLRPVFVDRSSGFIAEDAQVIGNITIGRDVSIWFGAVLRGDNDLIDIGSGSNIQDGAVIHVDPGRPVSIGQGVTIGHRAIVHGAVIGDNSLIGMGATLLNGSRIGENSLVGANALVTENKVFPSGSLIMGAPAKVVRPLTADEIAGIRLSSLHYVKNGRRFRDGLSVIPAQNRSD